MKNAALIVIILALFGLALSQTPGIVPAQIILPSSTLLGRTASGSGPASGLTASQAKTLLAIAISDVSGLQTALDGKASSSHTHTASQISDSTAAGRTLLTATDAAAQRTALELVAVASSGSASDLTSGTLPAARMPALTGDVTTTAGSVSTTIASNAVTFEKMQQVATSTLLGRSTSGTGNIESLTASQAKTLLAIAISDVSGLQAALDGKAASSHTHAAGDITAGTFTSARFADNTIAPARLAFTTTQRIAGRNTSGAGAGEELTYSQILDWCSTTQGSILYRGASGWACLGPGTSGQVLQTNGASANPSWATVSGGSGSPGGSSGQIQYNNSGTFAGASSATIEGNELRLPVISTPTAPASDGVKLYGQSSASRPMPGFRSPSGLPSIMQPFLGRNKAVWVQPVGNSTTLSTMGMTITATGTATAANVGTTNLHQSTRRLEYLVTTASTTAVAGFRSAAAQFWRGNASGLGGWHMVVRWGPATGVSTTTNRCWVGLRNSTAAPTDVEPSSQTNMIGMGWDAADANVQMMHNAASTTTKIDLGSNFAVRTTDRTAFYELALYAPPNGSSVSYEVIDLVSGNSATGTITTNLPSNTTLLAPVGYCSVGGTSSVIGIALMSLYIETDY